MRSGEHGHERVSLLASLRFEVALHVRQHQRLDQQTLSFVAATAPAEAHDNSPSRAFRLHPPRQQRVAPRQELEILETNAAQTSRTPIFHHPHFTPSPPPLPPPS